MLYDLYLRNGRRFNIRSIRVFVSSDRIFLQNYFRVRSGRMVPRVGDAAVALRRFAPFRAIFPASNDALRVTFKGWRRYELPAPEEAVYKRGHLYACGYTGGQGVEALMFVVGVVAAADGRRGGGYRVSAW